ncbi:MAG: hypothetical protein IPP14_04020 [Planctomycetes bacterium]|nr:hypothetical protein [Planctomycetota bacterium]
MNPRGALSTTLLALLCCALAQQAAAQTIDREKSRFVSEPYGRAGTCAPFRLVFSGPAGSTAQVQVQWGSVTLSRQVAVANAPAQVILPVPLVPDATVVVRIAEAQDSLQPRLPPRPAGTSVEQPYVAVFATDPLYARAVLPVAPGQLVADYYDIAEFFADWRLLDGYDAVVIFNPDDSRLPAGAQRAIAEFCSLGGALFVAGSFRFGEQAADLPAPGEAQPLEFRSTPMLRFEYGAGAIYRCEYEQLRRARQANAVIRDALLDHLWQGATDAPGGTQPSRAAPQSLPLLQPGHMAQAAPGVVFWVLALTLLLACGVGPTLAARLGKRASFGWLGMAALMAGLGAAGAGQTGPQPLADTWAVVVRGPRDHGPQALRGFVLAEESVETWLVDLDAPGPRPLPRPFAQATGHKGWVVDLPLARAPVSGKAATLRFGLVEGENFRDFAAGARMGEAGFDRQSGRVLDWWLQMNAWRGRAATLAPLAAQEVPVPPGAQERPAGAIAVTMLRAKGGN